MSGRDKERPTVGGKRQKQQPKNDEVAWVCKKATKQEDTERLRIDNKKLREDYKDQLSHWADELITSLFSRLKIKNNPAIRDNLKRRTLDLIWQKQKWEDGDGSVLNSFDPTQSYEVNLKKFVENAVSNEQLALMTYHVAKEKGNKETANELKSYLWGCYETKVSELARHSVDKFLQEMLPIHLRDILAIRNNLVKRKLELFGAQWSDILDSFDPAKSFHVHLQKEVDNTVPDEQLVLEYQAAKERKDSAKAKEVKNRLCTQWYPSTEDRINRLAVKLTGGYSGLSQRVVESVLDIINEKWANGTILGIFDPAKCFRFYYQWVIIYFEVLKAIRRILNSKALKSIETIRDLTSQTQQIQTKNYSVIADVSSLLKPYKLTLLKLREGLFNYITAHDRAVLKKWAKHQNATPIEIWGRLNWLETIARFRASRRREVAEDEVIKAQAKFEHHDNNLIFLEKQAETATGAYLGRIQYQIKKTKVQLQKARSLLNVKNRKLRELKGGLKHKEIVWVLLGDTDEDSKRTMKIKVDQMFCRLNLFLKELELVKLEQKLKNGGCGDLETTFEHIWYCIKVSERNLISSKIHPRHLRPIVTSTSSDPPIPGKKPEEKEDVKEWKKQWNDLMRYLIVKLRPIGVRHRTVNNYVRLLRSYVSQYVVRRS